MGGARRSQAVALVSAALVAVVAVVWAAVAGGAPPARQPQVFAASLVLADDRPLTVVDVATAAVTVQLPGVYANVGAASYGDVQPVAADGGTYLVDRLTGTFNLLGADDYVVDARGPGVTLAPLAGATAAAGLADGASLFIVRSAPASTVTLVDRATVEAGASGGRDVPVAGSATLDGRASGDTGAAVVAGHALWLLVAPPSGGCRLDEVRAPSPGAALAVTVRASFAGGCATVSLAAIGGAAGGAVGAAPVVGVAAPGGVRLLSVAASPSALEPSPALQAATALTPVSGMPGAAAWLASTPSGFTLVRAAPGRLLAATELSGLGATADLAPAAWAAGALYTLDRSAADPTLQRIDPSSGATTTPPGGAYPVVAGETATFAATTITAIGTRLVINNPGSLLAALVFADGSRQPVTVDKRTALNVSASGPGVPDLGGRGPATTVPAVGGATPARPLAPSAPPPAPVDVAASCQTTSVRPYAPTVTGVTPSTTGALVTWGYRLLDEHDCVPQTWSVHLTALDGAPAPAAALQYVDGQQQLEVGGLRPATSYSAVVTAYLPHASTPSAPVTFTTAPQGPDAPATVTTTADGQGHWVLRWSACDPASCLVAASTWQVTATACGGSYVGTPPTVTVPGAVTSTLVDAAGLGLLGTSVSFSVAGATATALVGAATADHTCTAAWQPPNPGLIALAGAARPDGSTLTATLTVSFSGEPTVAVGGAGPQFLYAVGGHTVGPTAATSVSVGGLAPGVSYVPQVTVWSAGHQGAGTVVSGRAFSQTVPWPAMTLSAAGGPLPGDPNQGSLTATVGGLPAGGYRAAGALVCGSNRLPVAGPLVATAGGESLTVSGIDLTSIGGACALSLTVTDTDDPNPYGGESPTLSTSVQLGSRPTYGFTAVYTGSCAAVGCGLVVSYDGDGQPASGGVDWVVTATVPGGSCPMGTSTSVSSSQPHFPVDLTAPQCSSLDGLTVTVAFRYLGASVPIISLNPSGRPTTTTTTTTTTPTTTTTTTTGPQGPPGSGGPKGSTTTSTTTAPPPSAGAGPTTSTPPRSRQASVVELAAARRWSGRAAVATLAGVGVLGVLVAPRRRRRR